ncbi:MAG TPA: hypothetical protein VNI61_06740 [Gemmatimonadales bacterium]|nr:hypothetical protein [Gemmatimonadales bacterium]
MGQRTTTTLIGAALAAALVAAACDRAPAPLAPQATAPQLHLFPDEELACFRLTGGGRIDKPEPPILMPQPKNTPDSRDFATFGFQARPIECSNPNGSGQLEWVEHNPAAVLGGFSFHGRVTWFVAVQDHYGETDNARNGCGRFSGFGTVRGRDGSRHEDVPFIAEHACDRGEPGVGRDHIRICIGTADPTECNLGAAPYRRDGILTGGNIQKHRMS